jgi:uncharacterized protein YigA (DUF484 family)
MTDHETINDEQVIVFLKNNPDFFQGKDNLLACLNVPHASGGAISLIERQVEIHKERNIELRHRLTALIGNARKNDQLFENTKRLILSLLHARTLDDIQICLYDGLKNDFNISFVQLRLFSQTPLNTQMDLITTEEIQQRIRRVFAGKTSICGELDNLQMELLFPEHGSEVKSAASTQLRLTSIGGVLSVGSKDENYFRSSMDTLFLSYIGEATSLVIARTVSEENIQKQAEK